MKFYTRNKEGVASAIAFISELPTDKIWEIDVKEEKTSRSLAQNKLWHKWVRIIGDSLGYIEADMKHLLKDHLLEKSYYTNNKTGELTYRIPDTSELNVNTFSRLIHDTEMLAANQGIALPHPEDYHLAMKGYKP